MFPISDHFNGKKFHNSPEVVVTAKGAGFKMARQMLRSHPHRQPATAPGPFVTDAAAVATPPANDVRVTWLGHSTQLLQVEGVTLLTDPVWYQRTSPFTHVGPKRFFPPPLRLNDLPRIDAVLLSHDHYDHLDRGTMMQLLRKKIPVITMLGVGQRLRRWGANPALITELDWWQATHLQHLAITAAPAQHFSGRSLTDRFTTLWGSFAINSSRHAVYFGADSGYGNHFTAIGQKLGPFDLALLDTGAYYELWADIHMGPENAVKAHQDLGGKLLMPIHWGTFSLAFHPWKEPVERVMAAAAASGVSLLLPAPGKPYVISEGPHNSGWWQQVV